MGMLDNIVKQAKDAVDKVSEEASDRLASMKTETYFIGVHRPTIDAIADEATSLLKEYKTVEICGLVYINDARYSAIFKLTK